jgi:hypothetical protein
MNKALLVMAALVLTPLPASGQGARPDDRDGHERRDTEIERILRELGGDDMRGGGLRRGAGFFLRSGDSTVAVRCDPRESMRSCLDTTLTLLERVRSAAGGAPPAAPPR